MITWDQKIPRLFTRLSLGFFNHYTGYMGYKCMASQAQAMSR